MSPNDCSLFLSIILLKLQFKKILFRRWQDSKADQSSHTALQKLVTFYFLYFRVNYSQEIKLRKIIDDWIRT